MRVVMAMFIVFGAVTAAVAQDEDTRTQYPFGLKDSFVEISVGNVQHPFGPSQLEPGFEFGSTKPPTVGVRLGFGHRFNERFSAQIMYARPVQWFRYEDVTAPDGTVFGHSTLTNLTGATLRMTVPLAGRFSVHSEAGLGIVTRSGFGRDGRPALREVNYATILLSGGLTLLLSDKFDLVARADYAPPSESRNQPHTLVLSGGAVFNMRPRSQERVRADAASGAIFPKNLLQVGHSTNELGTGVNSLFSSKVPIFWGGSAEVSRGIHLLYQRNIYHTAKVFSLDVGASIGNWWGKELGENFWSVSLFPRFRFTPLRTKPLDAYLTYSLAGPTWLSRTGIEGRDTAGWFTFQDLMGAGVYFGDRRQYNLEASIGHFSNGNLTAHNAGVKIPFTLLMGMTF